MTKKKIIFINNHFQYADGTVRALIGLVNNIDLDKFDVTILPLYRCDRGLEKELKPGIKLNKAFGFYVRGLSKIARRIPMKWMYKWWIDGQYDIEVAFQCDVPTLLVCNSQNPNAVHVAWMHGYGCYDCYERLDKVVCVSKYNADKARDEMRGRVDVAYVYNLVDDKPILEMAGEPIDLAHPMNPVFVSVGRHSPEKGYVRLVRIMSELRDEGYQFHLILVGDGPEHVKIKDEIIKRDMQKVIILPGSQTNPHKFTSKSDVFICSSFSEGYSTACTEAAILGIPIITTSVPGSEEIINECECGRLTSLEDEDLKSAIREVLIHPELIAEWKETLKHTSKRFALKARQKATTELFEEFWFLSEKKCGKNDEESSHEQGF